MGVTDSERSVVNNLFKAMQAGADGEEAMMALFAQNAVFTEPFSGEPRTHTGKDAIRASFREQWKQPAPDLKLVMDRVDRDGDRVRAEWTCTSPVFPTPMRGTDWFEIQNGKITRLTVEVTEMPAMEHGEGESP